MGVVKGKSVCLICLKRFIGGGNEEDDGGGCGGDLYSRFLLFSCRFLKVPVSERLLESGKQFKEANEGKSVAVFCGDCEVLVGNLCRVYGEYQQVKLKLLDKVDNLEKVTRQGQKSVSVKLCRGLIRAVAEQLNVTGLRQVELYRKSLMINCTRKTKLAAPQVLVPRGLFPEEWKYTFSATKKSLMTLIIVFALASQPPEKTPVVKIEPEEKLRRRLGARKRTCTAFEDVIKLERKNVLENGEYEDDEDPGFPDAGGDDNANDSDWSTGAVSPSRSVHSAGDSDAENDFLPTKRPRRTRGRVSLGTLKDDDAADEQEDSKDPDFAAVAKKIISHQRFKHQAPGKKATISCKVCKKLFFDNRGYAKHLHFIHGTHMDYICTCGFKCPSHRELLLHKRALHSSRRSKVPSLRKSKSLKTSLRRGYNKTRKDLEIPSGCPHCEEHFPSRKDLHRHVQLVHISFSKFECPVCLKIVVHQSLFQKHLATHDQDSGVLKIFHCEVCGQSYFSESLLNDHFVQVHQEEYSCDLCPAKYPTGSGLRVHLESSHEKGEKIFFCSFCHRRYSNEQLFKIHRKVAHLGNERIFCDEIPCPEEFENVAELNEHLKGHLEGNEEAPWKCGVCKWQFLKERSLKVHLLLHIPLEEDLTGYRCPETGCPKKTLLKTSLISHYKESHLEKEGPYECRECQNKFVDFQWFKIHLRLHQEATVSGRQWNCEVCGKECRDSVDLWRHKGTEHVEPRKWKRPSRRKMREGEEEEKIWGEGLKRMQDLVEEAIEESGGKIQRGPGRPPRKVPRKRPRLNLERDQGNLEEKEGTTMEEGFKCTVCDAKWDTGHQLNGHLKEHEEEVAEEEKKEQCYFCHLRFRYPQTLQFHDDLVHRKRSFFRCDATACQKRSFRCVEDLNEHLKETHLKTAGDPEDAEGPEKVETLVYCRLCSWGFTNPDFRELHELCHIPVTTDQDKPCYLCPICAISCSTINQLTGHYNQLHGKDLRPFKCPQCPASYFNRYSLNLHIFRHTRDNGDPETGPSVCIECGKTFKDQYRLKQHQRNHDPKYHVICPEGCGVKFVNRSKLDVHMRRVHSKGDRYPCPTCGSSFVYQNALNQHMKWVHGPPQYQCDMCPNRYRRPNDLRKHKRIHGPDKDIEEMYVCAECGKNYKSEEGLKYHLKSVHTPDHMKKYGCPECEYRTHRRVLLAGHVKVCFRNKGVAYDEKKFGPLPNTTKYKGPPRKKGRRPRKKEVEEEEEMEDKSTTEDEVDEVEEEKEEEKPEVKDEGAQALGVYPHLQPQVAPGAGNVINAIVANMAGYPPLPPDITGGEPSGMSYQSWLNSTAAAGTPGYSSMPVLHPRAGVPEPVRDSESFHAVARSTTAKFT